MLHTYYDFNVCFFRIFVSQFFGGNIGLRIWSSPNCVKFGTEVHYYIIITVFMVIFSKFMSFIFFRVNLVQKSEVIQINRNWVQGRIAICLLRFYCLFLQKFCHSYNFGQIWSQNLVFSQLTGFMYIINNISWFKSKALILL